MKENMKRRLAVFLCILFVLPAIMAILPQTAQEVQAGMGYLWWSASNRGNISNKNKEGRLSVEKGASFYVGDFIHITNNRGQSLGTVSMFNASYSTSDGNVAAVDNNGCVEAREIGRADITVTYRGRTLVCALTVEEAGSFGTNEEYTKLATAADELAKNLPEKITVKNGFRLLKIFNQYEKVARNLKYIDWDGLIMGDAWSTDKLAVPNAGRYYKLCYELESYVYKNSPLSTRSAKKLRITSISATESKVTIKLAKTIRKEQILALKIFPSSYIDLENDPYPRLLKRNFSCGNNNAYFFISIADPNIQYKDYTGLACMKKGSRTVTVIPLLSSYKEKKAKLEKNKTYQLDGLPKWMKGKTFTVR